MESFISIMGSINVLYKKIITIFLSMFSVFQLDTTDPFTDVKSLSFFLPLKSQKGRF